MAPIFPDGMDLTWEAYFTLAALLMLIVALVKGIGRTDLVLLGTLGLLLFAGIVSPEDAFAGFSNPAVIAIASLCVAAAGMEGTGAFAFLDRFLEPRSSRSAAAVLRAMWPLTLFSSVVNSTPIVAMLIPRVQAWTKSAKIPPPELPIPIWTAAIAAGGARLGYQKAGLRYPAVFTNSDPALDCRRFLS